MDARRLITATGAGITAFLLVTVAVVELLAIEFSALIGLPIGIVAGIAVTVVVFLNHDGAFDLFRLIAAALAGFGYGIMATVAASYVNLLDVQFETRLTIGAIAGVLAVALAVVQDR
jgi:hypothetical protein